MNGIEATSRLAAECPATKVLVLSMYDDDEHVQRLLAAGAAGFVLKQASSDELVRAIREVVAGGLPLSPSVSAKVVRAYARRVRGEQEASAAGALTAREREVLIMVAQGQTNQAIAERLGLSRKFILADQGFEILSISRAELYMLFFHPTIFCQMRAFVKTFKNLLYALLMQK